MKLKHSKLQIGCNVHIKLEKAGSLLSFIGILLSIIALLTLYFTTSMATGHYVNRPYALEALYFSILGVILVLLGVVIVKYAQTEKKGSVI